MKHVLQTFLSSAFLLFVSWNLLLSSSSMAADRYVVHFPMEFSYDEPVTKDLDYTPPRDIGIRLTLTAYKDGRIGIDGTIAWIPGREPDFGGYGHFEKGGLFRFTFEDSFGNKGQGTLQLLEHGTKARLDLKATQLADDGGRVARQYGTYPLELLSPASNKPLPTKKIVTVPGKYRVMLPTGYDLPSNHDQRNGLESAYIQLSPLPDGVIRLSGEIRQHPGLWLVFRGHGKFQTGDRLTFTFGDREGDKGAGVLEFQSAERVSLSLRITSYADGVRDVAMDRQLNRKYVLVQSRD